MDQAPLPTVVPAVEIRDEAKGLHNVFRITDTLYCGSSPDGEVGFQSLAKLGIKTVLSVDGARPDIATAHKHGMRYVHIPVGYDGITPDQVKRLARAVRDLPGPVYLHCHHGQHRGPAAAAAVHLCLDASCSVEQALAELHRAKTDPRYTGLYAAIKNPSRPTREDLDRVQPEFPEVAKVPDLTQSMAQVDARWDAIKIIKSTGWSTPNDQPDLDPPHEAVQLGELFREAARIVRSQKRPEELTRWMAEAAQGVRELEKALRVAKEARGNFSSLDKAFAKVAAKCTQCHAKYRDVPQALR